MGSSVQPPRVEPGRIDVRITEYYRKLRRDDDRDRDEVRHRHKHHDRWVVVIVVVVVVVVVVVALGVVS